MQNTLISSEEEIDELASELADSYVDYLAIDITPQQRKTDESIEDCLTHLEEICSVLDSYRQNNAEIPGIVETISSKQESLNKLYKQIDELEQYVIDTNRLLDQYENEMKEWDKKYGENSRIKQLLFYVKSIF